MYNIDKGMDLRRLTIVLALLVVTMTSCDDAGVAQPASPSAFFSSFSLASIIEANEQLEGQQTVSSGMVSEPPTAFFQLHEEAVIQIDPTDVSALMEAVRSNVEHELTSLDLEIVGEGGIERQGQEGSPPVIEYFSFRYSDSSRDGVINVWGVRGEGTSLTLIALITES